MGANLSIEELDSSSDPSYFLVAVSNKSNLTDCREYSLAGFPDTGNGAWSYADVSVGDYVSFLYGAKAYDLYKVVDKYAIANAEDVGPWPTLRFGDREYHFPFRLDLQLVREFQESLVRSEFRYVAENLLLRGGYSRSHFQADRTTLQRVSQMGERTNSRNQDNDWNGEQTSVGWVRRQGNFKPPSESRFLEYTLHSLLRQYLSTDKGLQWFVEITDFDFLLERDIEVLGERALPEGHVDLLLRDSVPLGEAANLPIEVKLNRFSEDDIHQLQAYMEQIEPECAGGVIIAETIPRNADVPDDIAVVRVDFGDLDWKTPQSFADIFSAMRLEARNS